MRFIIAAFETRVFHVDMITRLRYDNEFRKRVLIHFSQLTKSSYYYTLLSA